MNRGFSMRDFAPILAGPGEEAAVNLIHHAEPPTQTLTDAQSAVLDFINAFRRNEQCNPTMAEIAYNFSWRSANAAHEHCAALMRKGVLSKRPNRARGYVVNAGWAR